MTPQIPLTLRVPLATYLTTWLREAEERLDKAHELMRTYGRNTYTAALVEACAEYVRKLRALQ